MPRPTISVVVPVYNKAALLPTAIDSIVAAARAYGPADVTLVDNGSTDGSFELLGSYGRQARVLSRPGIRVAAVRNRGAAASEGELLCFLDCDIMVGRDYFERVAAVFAESGAAAVGYRVGLPPQPGWIERAWDALHARDEDGDRNYINSGNFAVRRSAFERVGGFDERLETGEDTDICRRLVAADLRVYASRRLLVGHLDNPKTLRAFFRREQWHGLGMGQGTPWRTPCRVTLMTAAFLATLLAALALALGSGASATAGAWLAAAATLPLLVPVTTVAFRLSQGGRTPNPAAATLLYTVYFAARSISLLRLVTGLAPRRPAPPATLTVAIHPIRERDPIQRPET